MKSTSGPSRLREWTNHLFTTNMTPNFTPFLGSSSSSTVPMAFTSQGRSQHVEPLVGSHRQLPHCTHFSFSLSTSCPCEEFSILPSTCAQHVCCVRPSPLDVSIFFSVFCWLKMCSLFFVSVRETKFKTEVLQLFDLARTSFDEDHWKNGKDG